MIKSISEVNKYVLRKCIDCGLEAFNEEDLELFCKGKRKPYGRQTICKNCYNIRCRDPKKYKPSQDKSDKKWRLKRIKFLGKTIYVSENRTNVCTKCGRKYPEELTQQTCMHHEIYDHQNPLAHTIELCKPCHNRLHHALRRK